MLKPGAVTALGTMSGTSLDGVDAAVIVTDGERIVEFGPSDYRAYSSEERAILKAHLGRWQDDDISAAARVVEDAHFAAMAGFRGIDVAGFHGQTLAHDPRGYGTHQCGDGLHLADRLGYPVVWDFRTEDVAQGGQGAPLAPFYHFALVRWIGAARPIAFLNLGGVGNITFVDPRKQDPQDDGALLAFDTGPANAPINDVMQARRGVTFDRDGALAATGSVDHQIIASFLAHPYFQRVPPKSLDRDSFSTLTQAVAGLNDGDAVATLTQAAVASVVRAVATCPSLPETLLVTGGGRKNRTMMQALSANLHCDVQPVEHVGLDGDMLEAQAFAYLAVRVARGLPTSAPGTTGVGRPTGGGTMSVVEPKG